MGIQFSNGFSITPNTDSVLGIVTQNLQLYLNAGNVSSYPGSGTSWTDLSNNAYTTTLVNGTGYSADGGGTFSKP